MGKMLRRAVIFSLAALMLVALAAPSLAGEPVVDEWRIPFLNTLTGPAAGWAGMLTFGAKDAVEQINAAGGAAGRPMVVEMHDTAGDAAKSVTEMSKVVKDSLIIFGPIINAPVLGAMPLVKRNNAFAFAVTASPMDVANFKPHLISLWGEFDVALRKSLEEWVTSESIKSVVILLNIFDPYFVYFQGAYRTELEAMGVKVLADVEVGEGIAVGSAVIKAMGQKPDGYAFIGMPVDAGKVVVELDKRGVKDRGKIFLYCANDDPGFFEVAKGVADGCYLWNIVNRKTTEPRWVAFEKRFKEAYPGLMPGMSSIPPQDMVYLAKAAIEDLGLTGDPAKLAEERQMLMDYIGNIKDFPGVTGKFDMVDYQLRAPAYLFKIEGGDVVLVKTFERF